MLDEDEMGSAWFKNSLGRGNGDYADDGDSAGGSRNFYRW
jgi:hypothetical protein